MTKIKNQAFETIEKDKSKLIMHDENNYFFPPETVVGESPSIAGAASAKAVAKLAAFMANKGTFEGKTLLDEATWDLMHSDAQI